MGQGYGGGGGWGQAMARSVEFGLGAVLGRLDAKVDGLAVNLDTTSHLLRI